MVLELVGFKSREKKSLESSIGDKNVAAFYNQSRPKTGYNFKNRNTELVRIFFQSNLYIILY